VRDLDLSKDIVQEVFIKVWENKTVFDNRNSIKSYLYKAVKNKCLDLLKSNDYILKNKLTKDEMTLLESDTYFEKEMVVEEVSRIVESALGTLPEKCKQIIKLSMKGYRNYQISEELSISVNTVKAQKRIGYQKLRPILKASFIFVLISLSISFL
jgi:RNA polymerase sigma-70 factor (ECF subfamily)